MSETQQLVEAIAQRAAAIVLEQLQAERQSQPPSTSVSPYLSVAEAAAYARCKRQRIDDLLSSRRLTRFKEGSRTLVLRADLDAWIQAERR